MTIVKLTTVRDGIRQTPDGRYEVRRVRHEVDGYATYRIYVDGAQYCSAEVVYERQVRPAIAAHIDSAGATWHPYLVPTS